MLVELSDVVEIFLIKVNHRFEDPEKRDEIQATRIEKSRNTNCKVTHDRRLLILKSLPACREGSLGGGAKSTHHRN